MQLNPTTPNSNYITADDLQELSYPRDSLDAYANIINTHIDVCRRQSTPQMRVRKQANSTPFTFNLQHPDPTAMRITIIFPSTINGTKLGNGNYKNVKKSITILLTFGAEKVEIQSRQTALSRLQKHISFTATNIALKIHEELTRKLPLGTKLAELPHIRKYNSKPNANRPSIQRIELESPRFTTSFYKLLYGYRITQAQSMLLLSEIADTLQAIHNVGYVHRDVKPDNILVKMDGNEIKHPCLNDLDLTCKIGDKDRVQNYYYWDASCSGGLALPNTDIYGVTLCAFQALIPKRLHITHQSTQPITEDNRVEFFQKLLQIQFVHFQPPKTAKTIPELVNALDRYINEQGSFHDSYIIAQAQAQIIEMMAREEKNSQELFKHYQTNPHLHGNIPAFLESAKIAIPTLSTAQSLAEELRKIHQILTTPSVDSLSEHFTHLNLSDPPAIITNEHITEKITILPQRDVHRLINQEICYQLKHPGVRRVRKITTGLPFTLTLENIDPTRMKILIYFYGQSISRQSHKQTKKSISLSVNFTSNPPSVTVNNTVVCRHKLTHLNRTLAQFNQHQYLRTLLPAELAKDIPQPRLLVYTNKFNNIRYELEFDRYDASLLSALHNTTLSDKDGLAVLSTVGKTLQSLHNVGIVYHNVKPTKILINQLSNAQVEPHLQNYRLSQPIGAGTASDYPYWDALDKLGIVGPNSDVYGLAFSALNVVIPSTFFLINPNAIQWLHTEEGQAKLLCYALLRNFTEISDFVNSPHKNIPILVDCIHTVISRKIASGESIDELQTLLTKTKAQAAIIAIMAREEKNSDDLARFYNQSNQALTDNISERLNRAKSALPTLSTAQSLAEELHKIHLEMPLGAQLNTKPVLFEKLAPYLNISKFSRDMLNMEAALMWQLFEQTPEKRISKVSQVSTYTFAIRSINAHTVHLQIIYPKLNSNALLANEINKRIKTSVSATITFKEGLATVHAKKTTLHRFKKHVRINSIENNLSFYTELYNKVSQKAKLAPPPHVRKYISNNNTNREPITRIELESAHYDTNLSLALDNSSISIPQAFLIFSDVADKLQAIHDAGFVHKNTRPKNITVKKRKNGDWKHQLISFERAKKIGYQDGAEESFYWDKSACNGISLPNTDIYGLTVSAFTALIPSKRYPYSDLKLLTNQDAQLKCFHSTLPLSLFQAKLTGKTIAEQLITISSCAIALDKQYERLYREAQAKAKIILMMAREVKNSQELFKHYQMNPHLQSDIPAFLESAKTAIPTLSTAETLAIELSTIHELLQSS